MRTTCALGFLCLALMTGCANFATLQTAETMQKDKFELGVGMTVTSYELQLKATTTVTDDAGNEVTTTDTESADVTVPALSVAGRYGLSDRFELHGVLWVPFGAMIGGKYMLVGKHDENGFIFSPGLDISAPVTISVNDAESMLLDVYVPLHMGYRASDVFEVYWTPKYVMRFLGDEAGHAAGSTLGVAMGTDTKFMIEASALYDTITEKPIINVGIGAAFQ